MNKISQIYSTLFFIGYLKWFPGTVGSLASLIIIFLLHKTLSNFIFIFLFICFLVLSIKLIEIYSKNISKHDAGEIIIDEFLGIYLIIIFYNNFNSFNEFVKFCLIFLIFRFFDIFKPFPVNWIDKNFKNAYGIVLDDIVAGIYTIIILSIINAYI